MDWIVKASRLRSKALAVGLAIWFEAGRRNRSEVKLGQFALRRFGFERRAVYRALKALESAGLVSVERHRGRHPVVTIQDVE